MKSNLYHIDQSPNLNFSRRIKTLLVLLLGFLVVFSSVGIITNESEEEVLEEDGVEWFADQSAFDLEEYSQEQKYIKHFVFNFSAFTHRFDSPTTQTYSVSVFHKIYMLYNQFIDFH